MGDVLTIEQYLRGFVAMDIPNTTLVSILAKRGIEQGSDVTAVSEKDADLALADVYLYLATLPSVKNNTEDSDGGWKHTEGGYQILVADKRAYRAMARKLLTKWGERLPMYNIVIRSW